MLYIVVTQEFMVSTEAVVVEIAGQHGKATRLFISGLPPRPRQVLQQVLFDLITVVRKSISCGLRHSQAHGVGWLSTAAFATRFIGRSLRPYNFEPYRTGVAG